MRGLEVHFRQCFRATVVVTFCVLSVLTAPVFAADEKEAWQPPPPTPDKWDWVQMTNGEWLKGEIIAMYDDVLEFDSDEFDLQKLDLEDIQIIRSGQPVQVAFIDDYIITGLMLVEGQTVTVFGEEEYQSTRGQVLSLTAGVPKERNFWRGKIGAGLNVRTGNTEQTEFNANASFMRRTPINRVSFDYLGNFSENQSVTLADNQRANAGWNRFLSRKFYISPVYGEFFRDPFQNIARRWTIGTGAGYQIIDSSKIGWSVDAGIAYQRTNFDDVTEGESTAADTPAFLGGTKYNNEITKWMDYFFEYSFQIVNQESGTYIHHLQTGFEFDIFSDFDFDVSVVWDRTQDPREDSDGTVPKQNDLRTIFGVSYTF